MVLRTGYINTKQLTPAVEKAIENVKRGKEVVHVRYNFDYDSGGDPALYFRIVLSDSASREDTLGDVVRRIEAALDDELEPYVNWGLIPYFRFRSASENAQRRDPEWV